MVKLHLGCGKKRLPGFTHVDIRPEVHPDIVSDVKSLPMIADASVQEIYFCHGLEHLKYVEVQPALREWRRVLMSGGILRLSVPDMWELAKMYVTEEECNREVDLALIRGAISGGQEYPSNIHYSVWDWYTLKDALEPTFLHVAPYDALEWLYGVFGVRRLKGVYFDWSLGRIAGREISLNVEARA